MSEEYLVSHPCITRYPGNPVLTSEDVPYSSDLVFNAGVIPWQGGYAMVFRNDYGYIGRASFSGTNLGLALSPDGLRWQVEEQPVFSVKDDEIRRVYDPRLTVVDGAVYMTFAVDTRHGLRGGIAGSEFGEGLAGRTDDHHVGQYGDLVPVLEEAGEDGAGHLRLLFEGGFVGFIAEQDVADRYGVADLFLKHCNNTAFNGLPLLGHDYCVCHYV